ncbi:CLUMA_CG006108, isoform A [Clunio marinus]|uniref:CLUMA_CG006108, isoform A n=1 Tax=Clunio marinus TaxID=568069 RepID=A0A1J1HWT8_9DIPT|nr:CLUMA_CG006108, isoform A [Clunio marinus]
MLLINSDKELSQIEPLPPLPDFPKDAERKPSITDLVQTTYSPISPNADRNIIKQLGDCDEEFRLSVSHENNNVLWDLQEFAKAGKLLKTPPMEVEFYDEYEMRKFGVCREKSTKDKHDIGFSEGDKEV